MRNKSCSKCQHILETCGEKFRLDDINMSAIVEKFKSQTSTTTRPGRGRAVPVYDGRSWPVIKCGAVYVTDTDKSKHVTKNIVTKNIVDQAKTSSEKKKRSSKYSLAVGSSFGHVHAFLKDSDHVLKALDQTKAEDKCLMLIRKPKSASKQMLKAHSWANLSAPDMHLRQPDGSMKPNPSSQSRNRTRPEYTLPRDQGRKWSSTNEISPRKAPSNHSSSFKELSTVVEQQQEDTKSDGSSWQQHQLDATNGNSLSYSYPSEHYPNLKSFGRAVSSVDLRHTVHEINNNSNSNRMGGAFNKSQEKPRPKGPPPPVPNKNYKNVPMQAKQGSQNKSAQQAYGYCVNNNLQTNTSCPDVISHVTDSSNLPTDRTKPSIQISHSKSDSGFFSDEMYDYGFKQELDMNNGSHMTSSPRSKKDKVAGSEKNNETKHTVSNPQNSHNRPRMEPEPQLYDNRSSTMNKGNYDGSRQINDTKSTVRSDRQDHRSNMTKEGYRRSEINVSKTTQNNVKPDMRNNQLRNERVHAHKQPSSPYYSGSHDNTGNARPVQQRPKSDYTKQESNKNGQNCSRPSPSQDDQVARAYSMGDLSAGYTFSLVGQKRNENVDDINNVGLTGSQLAEHFRKYRKIKQESKHDSLPFRGKSVDDSDVRGRLDQVQFSQPQSLPNSRQKAMHYGSLQHLPMSAENHNSDHRHVLPTKFREKTPMKPRRSLPQVPGDVDEKKNRLSEVVRSRISAGSRSNSSPSSGGSNRASEVRVGGVSATPSDREVSVLLNGNQNDIVWVQPRSKKPVCNNSTVESNHGHILPPDGQYGPSFQSLGTSESYSHHAQNTSGYMVPSGGRLSESGQTTLTSQSTVDSGYITNDPDQDPLSTSNYAKTVKQSAQNLYSANKMFKPSKGDHSQMNNQTTPKGVKSQALKEKVFSSKQAKETHTRNWLENHPGSYMGDYLKMGLNVSEGMKPSHFDTTDTNNNKDMKHRQVTELDLTDHARPKEKTSKSHVLMHHFSDPSGKESEKAMVGDIGSIKNKGMSVSMSQGLNMIEKNSRGSSGSFLLKSQPKFTGSLKDLLGTDKQIVPIEALRGDNSHLNSTLPGNWKYQHKPETSLKLLGKPSLFQILQNYNMYAVHMIIPDGFNILENIRMIECEVVLPSQWLHNSPSQFPSPKGNYAKIGGPCSAFRPVSIQNSQIQSVSMVTVMELSEQLSEMFETGSILKGDLVVEVNERLMIGESLSSLNGLLDGCHGEVLWTIARDRARETQQTRARGTSTPTAEDFRKMDHTINELTKELRRKDRTLKQLNALLPWKQTEKEGAEGKEPYICTLSEDEFIV